MNIRNYISSDHVMSVNEIVTSQAQMIQLLTIEINEKDKQINELQDKLEAYENMRKEAIEYIKKLDIIDKNIKIDYCVDEDIKDDLLNILNKVGGSDE